MQKINVMVVDNHPLIRDGIKMQLSDSNIEVSSEAASANDALSKMEAEAAEVVVVNYNIPGTDGLAFTQNSSEQYPDTKYVVITSHTDEDFVSKAIASGANAIIPDDVSKEELIEAIMSVYDGNMYVSTKISRSIANDFVRKVKSSNSDNMSAMAIITTREKEILELISEGYSSSEIAERLYISSRTVENHRANIMQKFRVKNAAALVRYAYEHGILNLH